jgi:hypothetical protein
MKRLTLTLTLMMMVLSGVVSRLWAGEPLGVFANYNTNCIQFIDPLTNTTTGPLLAGELGSTPGGLLDTAVTSGGPAGGQTFEKV